MSLVEGSITTPTDARRIREIREQSKLLVTIGACATSGGVQALRNLADIDEFVPRFREEAQAADALITMPPIITAWAQVQR